MDSMPRGGTNTEDALAQAAALPWLDQSGLPPNERGKQVVVLFSDGNPSAFRGQFKHKNSNYDGVAALDGDNNATGMVNICNGRIKLGTILPQLRRQKNRRRQEFWKFCAMWD